MILGHDLRTHGFHYFPIHTVCAWQGRDVQGQTQIIIQFDALHATAGPGFAPAVRVRVHTLCIDWCHFGLCGRLIRASQVHTPTVVAVRYGSLQATT